MNDDTELLRRYAVERSEPAFAELVRRQVDFVYSVALRHLGGDTHQAEDVTQTVFVALAREARELAQRQVLEGWLYRTAQAVAISESRQRPEFEELIRKRLAVP